MARIGQLFVELSLKANNFNAGIKQAQKDAKELEKSIKPLKDLLNDLGKPLAAAGAAITGTLVALTKVAANYGDQLDEAAEKTGLTVQQLARMKYAGEQLDTSFEGVSTGLKFLSKNLFEAATGSKEQIRLFKALGIQTKNASGDIRPVNDVLMEISGIFQNLPNGAGKTALAMQIFGKAGQDLIPFLNAGPEGLKNLGDEAERLGIVIDGSSAKLGDEFNKALDRSKTAALGFAVAIGNVLLPSLTSLINKGNEAVVWASNLVREFPILTKAAGGLGVVLTGAGGVLLGLTALGTIAPKVATGLALIGSAIAPFAVLKGIKTYADLAAGISLIGQASLIAKLGLLGFAAGIGVAIGKLINMGLEMSGLQPHFDKFLASMANQASRSLFGKELFNTSDAMERSAASTKRAAESLAARGVIVERGTMTEQQYAEALAKAAREHFGLKDKVGGAIKATTDYDKVLRDLLESLKNNSTEVQRFREQVDQLKASWLGVVGTDKESKVFMTALREIDASFQLIPETILNLKNKVEELKKSTDPLIQKYLLLIPLIEMANDHYKLQVEIEETLANTHRSLSALTVPEWMREPMPEITVPAVRFDPSGAFRADLDAINKRVQDVSEEIGSMQRLPKEVTASIKELSRQGYTNTQIIAAMGDEIKTAGEVSKELGIPLDANTRRLLKQVEAAERAKQAAEAWSRAWSTAVGNIASQFSENVVDTLTSKLFPDRKAAASQRESLEKQITSIVQAQEKERLQAVIDKTVRGTRARKAAEMEMAAFERRLQQEAIAERDKQLIKLQNELAFQESAFKKFASGVKDIFADLGKSILKIFITDVFESIAKKATSVLADALGGIGKKLLGGVIAKGAEGFVGPTLQQAGGLASSAGGLGGTVGSTVGSMAGSVVGGVVAGVGGVIGPIIGALMTKGNLKRTEENSRETRDWLELQTTAWNPLFHEQTNWLKWIAEQTTILGQHLLPAVEAWGSNIVNAIQRTSGPPITLPAATVADIPKLGLGGFLAKGGLAFLHRGETVLPAGSEMQDKKERSLVSKLFGDTLAAKFFGDTSKAIATIAQKTMTPIVSNLQRNASSADKEPAPVTITVNYAPTIQQNFDMKTAITPLQVRHEIMPEALLDLELGLHGHGEKLAQIIRDRLNGLTGTAVPVGI